VLSVYWFTKRLSPIYFALRVLHLGWYDSNTYARTQGCARVSTRSSGHLTRGSVDGVIFVPGWMRMEDSVGSWRNRHKRFFFNTKGSLTFGSWKISRCRRNWLQKFLFTKLLNELQYHDKSAPKITCQNPHISSWVHSLTPPKARCRPLPAWDWGQHFFSS